MSLLRVDKLFERNIECEKEGLKLEADPFKFSTFFFRISHQSFWFWIFGSTWWKKRTHLLFVWNFYRHNTMCLCVCVFFILLFRSAHQFYWYFNCDPLWSHFIYSHVVLCSVSHTVLTHGQVLNKRVFSSCSTIQNIRL